MPPLRALRWFGIALVAAGCPAAPATPICAQDADCPRGFTCERVSGLCHRGDAASADGAPADRGAHVDVATAEAAAPDRASTDRAVLDAGEAGDRVARDRSGSDGVAGADAPVLLDGSNPADRSATFDAQTDAAPLVDGGEGLDHLLVVDAVPPGDAAGPDTPAIDAGGVDSGAADAGELCPGGCTIASACVADGTVNLANACEACDVDLDPHGWSPLPDHSDCDDGLWCNGVNRCWQGDCTEHVDNSCAARCTEAGGGSCCGGPAEACCPEEPPCVPDHVCQSTTGGATCQPLCGDLGEACCANRACTFGARCDAENRCTILCGGRDQPCCEDGACEPSLTCASDRCAPLPCGGLGQACCPELPRCSTPELRCDPGSGTCSLTCGGAGQPCCADNKCLRSLTCCCSLQTADCTCTYGYCLD